MNQKKINQKNLEIFNRLQKLTEIGEEKLQEVDFKMAEIEKAIDLESRNYEESELATILLENLF